MPDTNIAPIYGSIHSYSNQVVQHPASDVIDDSIITTWYADDGNTNQWVIIDLGASYSITGFKAWCAYVSGTLILSSVKNYRIGLSNTSTDESDFTIVTSGQVPLPFWFGDNFTHTSHTTSISTTNARYIKYYMDDNWGYAYSILSAELYIYSSGAVPSDQADILSDATIQSNQGDISSDAYIIPPHIYTETATINSDAVVGDAGTNISSDAFVAHSIMSDAHIWATEAATIASDSMVYRSGSAAILPVFMVGRSTGRISDTIIEASGSRSLLIYTTDISTSDEVVVEDMITSNPMDMSIIVPPLGYQNYDWKYDWVVRTYDSAQYKFEIRTGDTLPELNTAVFSRINQGQIILRGQVPRYHQWRCHIWASGSGDFELHQFTIKGYVDRPANPLYRSLQEQLFTTISTIEM